MGKKDQAWLRLRKVRKWRGWVPAHPGKLFDAYGAWGGRDAMAGVLVHTQGSNARQPATGEFSKSIGPRRIDRQILRLESRSV